MILAFSFPPLWWFLAVVVGFFLLRWLFVRAVILAVAIFFIRRGFWAKDGVLYGPNGKPVARLKPAAEPEPKDDGGNQ